LSAAPESVPLNTKVESEQWMFCFKAGVLLEELKVVLKFTKTKLVWENNMNGNLDLTLSMDIPFISTDYAVMERSKKIKV
jgi:mannose-1-phosphate guanylyltransferase